METETKKPKTKFSLPLCPVRLVLLAVSAVITGLYFAVRGNENVMSFICRRITRPYHRLAGTVSSWFGFSLAELFYVLLVVFVIAYVIRAVVLLCCQGNRIARLYRTVLTLATGALAFYAGFCVLWGVYYSVSDFSRDSGIEKELVSTEQLQAVTEYFAALATEYRAELPQDSTGELVMDIDGIFSDAETLYDAVCEDYPSLKWLDVKPKAFVLSKALSYINFTGFFFPYTAEANINTDSPDCLIPSTVAHELAHQRGVASEDEANFVAVLASLKSENAVYCYSAALLAYIHLSNALYKADRDLWSEVYATLGTDVQNDIKQNNEYWAKYKTKVSQASETVYTGFLQSYGDDRGLQSYGDCVDLLVAYYYDLAVENR
jgi:hypothetical protein